MIRIACLGMVGLLWAQYELEGPMRVGPDSAQKTLYVRLRLSPYGLHYWIWGQGGPLSRWEMLLTPHRLWILDSAEKVAYFLPLTRTPAPPEPFLLRAEAGVWELRADTLRQVVVWDTTAPFSWEPWLPYLEGDRLGLAARYFRQGLPRRIEEYGPTGQLQWRWLVQKSTFFSSAPADSLPPARYRQLPWEVKPQQK
ncbi:MAG: hypothetical protein D6750_02095 [Bacteroidetes bacterium]|nr:MAG: hypothetical protein D6750_02095 [Bacteroidota bacterium]